MRLVKMLTREISLRDVCSTSERVSCGRIVRAHVRARTRCRAIFAARLAHARPRCAGMIVVRLLRAIAPSPIEDSKGAPKLPIARRARVRIGCQKWLDCGSFEAGTEGGRALASDPDGARPRGLSDCFVCSLAAFATSAAFVLHAPSDRPACQSGAWAASKSVVERQLGDDIREHTRSAASIAAPVTAASRVARVPTAASRCDHGRRNQLRVTRRLGAGLAILTGFAGRSARLAVHEPAQVHRRLVDWQVEQILPCRPSLEPTGGRPLFDWQVRLFVGRYRFV